MSAKVRRRTYIDFRIISRRKFTVEGISEKNGTIIGWMEGDISWYLADGIWIHHSDGYNSYGQGRHTSANMPEKNDLPTQ